MVFEGNYYKIVESATEKNLKSYVLKNYIGKLVFKGKLINSYIQMWVSVVKNK